MKYQSPALSTKLRKRRGFTLLETSLAISVVLGLSVALVSMLQQHVTFMGLVQRQSFLASEAPQIGNLVGRLFGSADHFFVYSNRDDALAGADPVLVDGEAVRLFIQGVDGETTEIWVTVESSTVGTDKILRCYSILPGKTEKSWTVREGLAGAAFHCNQGVLGVTLQGPTGEEISYYGGSR
jgi:prepilin-type N-terminal cleavage/methylation domain-containing protein